MQYILIYIYADFTFLISMGCEYRAINRDTINSLCPFGDVTLC